METEQNLILDLPFDEATGSATAYDFAKARHDATVQDCGFVAGRQGNCIRFDGKGHADIKHDVIPLSGDFTILAWVRPNSYPDGHTGKRIGLFCNTGQTMGYHTLWADPDPGTWKLITVKKSGNNVFLYIDMQPAGTIELPAALTGIALIQDIYGTEYGYADLDNVKVYNVVLSDAEIGGELNSVARIEYYLDGKNFRDFGIRVESSAGILDLPKLKAPVSMDWPDEHGKVTDLAEKHYQEREITLKCWLKASGKIDFIERVNAFYDYFRKGGTQRLMISVHPRKPLVYEVYCENGVAPDKQWRNDKMIGTFTLKLKEPDPVKTVIRHQRHDDKTKTVTLAFKSTKMMNIYWGDGTVDKDVYGNLIEEDALSHTYAKNGVYYIIIAGVIEDLADLSTSGILTWLRI